MKLEQLSVTAYGRLANFVRDAIPSGLVVVSGSNESGKSTLASLLRTILYGFYPVQRFPYRPWHLNEHPAVSAVLQLKDGRKADVHRRLTSQPQGTLTVDGKTTNLANRDLPYAEHVGRDLYGTLYAVGQENVRSFGDEQRAELEDRLLGGFGSGVLRPTRGVVAEFEERAGKLWRPDRRGTPRYKELSDALQGAKRRRQEANQREQEIREAELRRGQIRKELKRINVEMVEFQARVRRADTLLPVKRRLARIKELRDQIPDIDAVQALPEGIEAERRHLEEELKRRQAKVGELKETKQGLERTRDAFTQEDAHLLKWADQLDERRGKIVQHHQESENLKELKNRADRLNDRLADQARQVLAQPWDEQYVAPSVDVPVPDLKARIEQYQQWREQAERLKHAGDAADPNWAPPDLPWWPGAVAAVGGGLLVAFGLGMGWPAMWGIGLIVLTVGVAYSAAAVYMRQLRRRAERRRGKRQEATAKQRKEAEGEQDKARERVVVLLHQLPIAPVLLERPDLELHRVVAQIQEIAGERRRLLDELQHRRAVWAKQETDLAGVLKVFGEQETSSVAMERASQHLANTRQRQEACEAAAHQLEVLADQLVESRKQQESGQSALDEFVVQLQSAVGEDLSVDELVERARELQSKLGRTDTLQNQLEDEHPDLDQLKQETKRIDQDSEKIWSVDPESIERDRNRLRDLDDQKDELNQEDGTLRQKIESVADRETLGEVEGQIDRLEEQREHAARERDRLMLLANALREADKRFREKHQPDVLQRASSLLPELTNHCYDQLAMIPSENGGDQLHVRETKRGEYRPVGKPLSHGTLDQIHLAFRLAAIEHLDSEHEPLPLVIDEALINCDRHRLKGVLLALQRMAKTHQIFIFTCHDWLADALTETTGAGQLNLQEE